jgi:hypothetical protein
VVAQCSANNPTAHLKLASHALATHA